MDQNQKPVFIVGTLQEAGRIRAAGHRAESTHGLEAWDKSNLAMDLERQGEYAIILLGGGAAEEFSDTCTQAGAAFVVIEPDRVARAMADEAGFSSFLDDAEREAMERRATAIEEAHRSRLQSMGVYDVMDVAIELAAGEADRERVPTGLQALDDAIGGGLPTGGLTVLGATSSTGKTTLALQVADEIARRGRPVLFVTVEQGRHELVAKSISRLMRQIPTKNGGYYVAGASDLQSAKAREAWGAPMHAAFSTACGSYSASIAPNMKFMELAEQPTTEQIRQAAEVLREHRGVAPCVIIDYLQLLAPASDRMTERQAVDHNVMDLRHLARDLQTCVFVISSLNRASYSEGVTQEAFKESGAIEYGSDLLLGMQPRGLTERLESVPESKQKREARKAEREFKGMANREVEVRVLKNRGGAVPSDGVALDYSAVCNLFTCGTAGAAAKRVNRPRL